MAEKITISKKALEALIEKAVNEALTEKGKKAKKSKKGGDWTKKDGAVWTDKKGRTSSEMKKAHHEARQNRWENGKAKSSGMTSAQRRELAATLPYGYTTRQWNKAVAEFKAGGFR